MTKRKGGRYSKTTLGEPEKQRQEPPPVPGIRGAERTKGKKVVLGVKAKGRGGEGGM